jgi:hypothetical protein
MFEEYTGGPYRICSIRMMFYVFTCKIFKTFMAVLAWKLDSYTFGIPKSGDFN